MGTRTAVVAGDDAATTGAIARRLSDDGLRVVLADPADAAGAVRDLGSLDVVVAAAGRPAATGFAGTDPEEWYAGVMACLTPPFRLVRAAAPGLRRSPAGRVVLLGCGWTSAERPGTTAESAVHGAVVALTKTLARDLGPAGVTVNEVVTDPAGPAAPDVVAAAVSYLCGPAAGAVTGQLLTLGRGGPLRP